MFPPERATGNGPAVRKKRSPLRGNRRAARQVVNIIIITVRCSHVYAGLLRLKHACFWQFCSRDAALPPPLLVLRGNVRGGRRAAALGLHATAQIRQPCLLLSLNHRDLRPQHRSPRGTKLQNRAASFAAICAISDLPPDSKSVQSTSPPRLNRMPAAGGPSFVPHAIPTPESSVQPADSVLCQFFTFTGSSS